MTTPVYSDSRGRMQFVLGVDGAAPPTPKSGARLGGWVCARAAAGGCSLASLRALTIVGQGRVRKGHAVQAR